MLGEDVFSDPGGMSRQAVRHDQKRAADPWTAGADPSLERDSRLPDHQEIDWLLGEGQSGLSGQTAAS